MKHFLGVMLVCLVLSLFLGPLPFIVVGVGYFLKWVFGRKR